MNDSQSKLQTNEEYYKLPKCIYFNETLNVWSDNGCYLIYHSLKNNITICGCNHLTYFSARMEDFKPNVNFPTKEDFESFDKMFDYPSGILTVTVVFMLALILYYVSSRRTTNTKDHRLIVNHTAVTELIILCVCVFFFVSQFTCLSWQRVLFGTHTNETKKKI